MKQGVIQAAAASVQIAEAAFSQHLQRDVKLMSVTQIVHLADKNKDFVVKHSLPINTPKDSVFVLE